MKRFAIYSVFICTGILFLSMVSGMPTNAHSAPSNEYDIVGIDISRYQGKVDFQKVKSAGVRYIFARATDGITYQDSDFKRNFTSARAAGITVGAYHFYQTDDDPTAQLKNFTTTVSLKPGDLPPVVDIEKLHQQEDTDLSQNLLKFLDGLEAYYGVRPIIYTGLSFSNKYLTEFGNYPLWLAEYERDKPELPSGWKKWMFWQWSQSHTIPGIDGKVDADRYIGDEASFLQLLIQ